MRFVVLDTETTWTADLPLSMDAHDLDTGSLDEALDALDAAIDIMEDTDSDWEIDE